jgi:hypothetical protein
MFSSILIYLTGISIHSSNYSLSPSQKEIELIISRLQRPERQNIATNRKAQQLASQASQVSNMAFSKISVALFFILASNAASAETLLRVRHQVHIYVACRAAT